MLVMQEVRIAETCEDEWRNAGLTASGWPLPACLLEEAGANGEKVRMDLIGASDGNLVVELRG